MHSTTPMKLLAGLMLSPYIIFISNSLNFFLANSVEFGYNLNFILPIILVGLFYYFIGVFIWVSKKIPSRNEFLFLYFASGPLFIMVKFSSIIAGESFSGMTALLATVLVVLGVAYYRFSRRIMDYSGFFSIVLALLIASDAYNLLSFYGRGSKTPPISTSDIKDSNSRQPNIYHIVFDGFQSDVFDQLLDESLKTRFLFFEN